MKIYNKIILFAAFALLSAMFQSCFVAQPVPNQTQVVMAEVVPPPWAPPYSNVQQVQYYYMPDIEVYYDVWNHEYIYLDRGNWILTPVMPPIYADYDLYNGYVVVLDYRVHQPWMHHELYVSHYPRYYYQHVYNTNEYDYRGFNENGSAPIYHPHTSPSDNNSGGGSPNPRQTQGTQESPQLILPQNPQRGNQHSGPGKPSQSSGQQGPRGNSGNQGGAEPQTKPGEHNAGTGKPSQSGQSQQDGNSVGTDPHAKPAEHNTGSGKPSQSGQSQSIGNPRSPQPVKYQGKSVGQPVKVKKDMIKPKVEEPKEKPKEKEKDSPR